MSVNRQTHQDDAIEIKGLEISSRVGDSAEERAFPQILTIDVGIAVPLAEAGRRDSLEYTVDYARTIADIKAALEPREFVLQETVAETVADIALRDRRVIAVSVRVQKKAFAGVASVGVSIFRSRA